MVLMAKGVRNWYPIAPNDKIPQNETLVLYDTGMDTEVILKEPTQKDNIDWKIGLNQVKDFKMLCGKRVGWWCPENPLLHKTRVSQNMYLIKSEKDPDFTFCILN